MSPEPQHPLSYAFPRRRVLIRSCTAEVSPREKADPAELARLLERQGLLVRDPEHEYLDFELGEALDQLIGASIHYRIAIGPNVGKKALTLRTVPVQPEPFPSALLAKQPGFSLHAATCCEANCGSASNIDAVQSN